MKRKIISWIICLSMILSSMGHAFAMNAPEETSVMEQRQETVGEQSEESSGSEEQPGESSESEEQPGESSGSEEQPGESSGSEEQPGESSGSEEQPGESSGSEEQPGESSENENVIENYIFSDNKGTDFILVDADYNPVKSDAEAAGAAVYGCSLEEDSYVIPDEATDPKTGQSWSVIALNDDALAENASFQSIQIPDSVKVIGKGAFFSCKKLTKITIPSGVTRIEEKAFASCTGLKTINFPGKPDIAGDVFDGVKATAYYPLSWTEVPASDTYGGEIKWVLSIPEVSNLKAVSAGYNSAEISWNKLAGADGYVVYRKDGNSWKRLEKVTASSYTDKNLNCGQTYTFTVRAYKTVDGEEVKGGYDKKGVSVKIIPGTVKLGTAEADGTSIKISWSRVDGANGYNIYRKTPAGKWGFIKAVGSSVTSYSDTKLDAGQYIYTVRAYRMVDDKKVLGNYDKDGISAYITPGTPKLTSVTGSAKSVTVKWNQIAGAEGYYIYRKTSSSEKWKRLNSITGGSNTSYKDTTAVSGTYYYTVRAYIKADNKTVLGGYVKKGISITIPVQPKLVSAASSKSKDQAQITVKWESVPRADGYRVYRKVNNGGWKLYTTIKSRNTLSYVDKKVTSGIIYTYTVRAYLNAGDAVVLSSYDAKGVKAVGYMDAPEVVLAAEWYDSTYTYADLYIIWSEIENADGYIVYMKEAGDSKWSRLAKWTEEEAYVDDDVYAMVLEEIDLSKTEYFFTVRAYKTVDGKEVLSNYSKKGESTDGVMDLDEF